MALYMYHALEEPKMQLHRRQEDMDAGLVRGGGPRTSDIEPTELDTPFEVPA